MANMSYIRFENTYQDLVDCFNTLTEKDIDELSVSERRYAIRLIQLCENMVDEFAEQITDTE
jgi:hypothetical protein